MAALAALVPPARGRWHARRCPPCPVDQGTRREHPRCECAHDSDDGAIRLSPRCLALADVTTLDEEERRFVEQTAPHHPDCDCALTNKENV